ncbi:hypothetical protein HFO99_26630 [Rhizobium leguminosarum]|nr:hypothetical protein [Rhizobium leguminosarum]
MSTSAVEENGDFAVHTAAYFGRREHRLLVSGTRLTVTIDAMLECGFGLPKRVENNPNPQLAFPIDL